MQIVKPKFQMSCPWIKFYTRERNVQPRCNITPRFIIVLNNRKRSFKPIKRVLATFSRHLLNLCFFELFRAEMHASYHVPMYIRCFQGDQTSLWKIAAQNVAQPIFLSKLVHKFYRAKNRTKIWAPVVIVKKTSQGKQLFIGRNLVTLAALALRQIKMYNLGRFS
jgi:hypothetical protein